MKVFWIDLLIIFLISVISSFQDFKSRHINLIFILSGSIGIYISRSIFYSLSISWIFLVQGILLAFFYTIIYLFSKHKLGKGDIFFGFFTGISILKWQFLWISISTSTFLFLIFYLIVRLKKINLQQKKIPFIPFMSAGLIFTYILSYSL